MTSAFAAPKSLKNLTSQQKKTAYCDVCKIMGDILSHNLLYFLVRTNRENEVLRLKAETRAKGSYIDNGKAASLIADNLENNACQYSTIINNLVYKQICHSVVEEKFDELSKVLLQFSKRTEIQDVTSSQDIPLPFIHEFKNHICHQILNYCENMGEYSEPVPSTKKIVSQYGPYVPEWPELKFDGRVFPCTSSNINDFITGSDAHRLVNGNPSTSTKDLIVYWSFPDELCFGTAAYDNEPKVDDRAAVECRNPLADDEGNVHRNWYPVYQQLARLMIDRTDIVVAHLNVRSNNLVHPYEGHTSPAVSYHTAGKKTVATYFVTLGDGSRSLWDALGYAAEAASPTLQLWIHCIASVVESDMKRFGSLFQQHHTAQEYASSENQAKFAQVLQLAKAKESSLQSKTVTSLSSHVSRNDEL
jgi:hypothetical protein